MARVGVSRDADADPLTNGAIMTVEEGRHLELIYHRLGELESGQRVLIEQGRDVKKLLECHAVELFGAGEARGIRTRLDGVEAKIDAASKHRWAIWGAILSLAGTIAAGIINWAVGRLGGP